MKFLCTIFTLIGVSFSIVNAQTTLSGRIQHATTQTAVLYTHSTSLGEKGVILETPIDKNNQFQFDLNTAKAIPAILQIGDFNCLLFLFPEKSVHIDVQILEEDQVYITFKGAAGPDNQFYLQYQNLLNQEQQNLPAKLNKKFRPKDFLAYQTDLKAKKLNFLNEHPSNIDQRLIAWLENDAVYHFANNLLEYPNREYLSQTPSKKYYNFLKDMRYNNDGAILQPSYQRFILGYVHYQLLKPQGWGFYWSPQKQYQFIRRFFVRESLYYLQFFILKTNMELGDKEKVEDLYRAFVNSDAPIGFKQQLRTIYQYGEKNIIGQSFPTNLLQNLNEPFFKDNLKEQNGKLFYVWQNYLRKDKIGVIKELAQAVNKSHRVDFGLVGLTTAIQFPKSLARTPHFWIAPYSLENYVKNFPIRAEAYLLFINKYGQVLEYSISEITPDQVKNIVDFMERNYNKRAYSTLSNSFFR